ncbi:MAG TPA: hypothetical protein VFP65_13090 [Anaeromyxobacteraceae bacterium]|nr:hypothetical protein [Anaeromyxobacteraceae bacterium]
MLPRTVADHLADLRFSAPLDGAARTGEARSGARLVVRLGLWLGEGEAVVRARYRASTCAALLAYAEAACALLEAGEPPAGLGPGRLRAAVRGVHPVHLDRADLVARALAAAAAHPHPPAVPGVNA